MEAGLRRVGGGTYRGISAAHPGRPPLDRPSRRLRPRSRETVSWAAHRPPADGSGDHLRASGAERRFGSSSVCSAATRSPKGSTGASAFQCLLRVALGLALVCGTESEETPSTDGGWDAGVSDAADAGFGGVGRARVVLHAASGVLTSVGVDDEAVRRSPLRRRPSSGDRGGDRVPLSNPHHSRQRPSSPECM
jgi:hypothetical protein